MNSIYGKVVVAVIVVLMSVAIIGCQGRLIGTPADCNDISRIIGDAEPDYELKLTVAADADANEIPAKISFEKGE